MKLKGNWFKASLGIFILAPFLSINAQDLKADNMLLFQRESGGWYKQFRGKAFEYDKEFSATEKEEIAKEVKEGEATIDNGATTKEIRYLVTIYKKINEPKYLAAAENGIKYLLEAQYKNGGWPQYYPDKRFYRAEITYNDNAIINVLNVLQDITLGRNNFDVVNPKLIKPCELAVNKGIDCIVKTQIKSNGVLTAWCQQYDEVSLKPAKARAYELPSISGSESVSIVQFLMKQPNPSAEVKNAINTAMIWFQTVKIQGYKVANIPDPNADKGFNKELVADASSTIWARYYEIETNKPFFCDRDGVKKYDIKEIGYERRNGYAWYGNWAQKLIDKDYPEWLKKNQ